MGNRMSAKVHNDGSPPAAARPEQEEPPDGVLDADTEVSLKGIYEDIALHIIGYMNSHDQNEKKELQQTLERVLKTAQDIVELLDDAPMGIGTGLKICRSVLKKCQEVLEVEGSIRMLVLDVVMVCELMSSALEAVVPPPRRQQQQQQQQQAPTGEVQPAPPATAAEQGGGGPASGQQPSPSQQFNSVANAINSAIGSKPYKAFLASKGGRVHVAYLYMALDVAQKLINEYDQQDTCMPWKALAAGSMIAKAQAATELLATARERFCQAIVTGKALGEQAAERVAETQAKQTGAPLPEGYVLLQRGGRRKIFVIDQQLDSTYLTGNSSIDNSGGAGSSTGCGSGGSVARYSRSTLMRDGNTKRKCMALSASLEQCKKAATMVFEVDDPFAETDGGSGKHVLCVCTIHGKQNPVLSEDKLRYPVGQSGGLNIITDSPVLLVRQANGDTTSYNHCIRMSAEQARNYTSADEWGLLQGELAAGAKAGRGGQGRPPADNPNKRYCCASGSCSAEAKRFYVKCGLAPDAGKQADVVYTCGKPGCYKALDQSATWKLVYTHDLKISDQRKEEVQENVRAFADWSQE